MSLVLQSSGGGQITIQEPATASNFTQTLPAATGEVMVSGNQPAFAAYLGTSQTVTSATLTKLTFNAEFFDTANAFDSTTNYRFTPQVAGYYQVTLTIAGPATATGVYGAIYKNGAVYSYGSIGVAVAGVGSGSVNTVLVSMNGTTDYLEGYVFIQAASGVVAQGGVTNTQFQASMVRAA
jgi:hypothetical protein